MNRKRETYDRLAVGVRLRSRRQQLGMTIEELAEKIDRAPKYVSDIERGNCGMSLETLMAFSSALATSMDYLILGNDTPYRDEKATPDIRALTELYGTYPENKRQSLLEIVRIFLASVSNTSDTEHEKKVNLQ